MKKKNKKAAKPKKVRLEAFLIVAFPAVNRTDRWLSIDLSNRYTEERSAQNDINKRYDEKGLGNTRYEVVKFREVL